MKKSTPLLIALALLMICAGGKPLHEPRCFDPWISGMCWSFPKTISNKAGKLQWRNYSDISEAEHDLTVLFYNQDRTEILMFAAAPGRGTGTDDIYIAQVFRNKYLYDPKIKTLNIRKFKTGKGVQLGMNVDNLTAMLGEQCKSPEIREDDQGISISYVILPGNSYDEMYMRGACLGERKILDRYNMANYWVHYTFKDGRLSKIEYTDYQ